ncbi:hypothetical protein H6783_03390 [Candidatus Nomurabacteria bacterium]|nr:hypothetical protein [Candidatus Nomurabacteria bacterium]
MRQDGQVAVVIDGANFAEMRIAHGGSRTKFDAIPFIAKKVSRILSVYPTPVSTIHPDDNRSGHPLFDDMKHAGISSIPVPSSGGLDDEFVVCNILRFARCPKVSAIVVFGCDHYEATELLEIARARRSEGNPLKGYLVGTEALNGDGNPMTSPRIVERLRRSRTASFVEIGQFCNCLSWR